MDSIDNREKKLSLIVVSMLNVVNECAVRSYEDILKNKDIFQHVKDVLKDDKIKTLHYWAFIFYLFNAVYGVEKKIRESGFTKEEFMVELMVQLQRAFDITSLDDFKVIENYNGGLAKFIGNKLCHELNIRSFIVEFAINGIFSSYLLHGFYPSLDRAWSINEFLEKRKTEDNKKITRV